MDRGLSHLLSNKTSLISESSSISTRTYKTTIMVMLQISGTVNYPFKTNSRRAYLLLGKQDHVFFVSPPVKLANIAKFLRKPIWRTAARNSRPKVFFKKSVLRNFAKFIGKHLRQNLVYNKVADPATLLKKRLWHRWFPVNFAKFLRTPFLTEHLR